MRNQYQLPNFKMKGFFPQNFDLTVYKVDQEVDYLLIDMIAII